MKAQTKTYTSSLARYVSSDVYSRNLRICHKYQSLVCWPICSGPLEVPLGDTFNECHNLFCGEKEKYDHFLHFYIKHIVSTN